MVQQGGRYGLVQEGSRAATEVPADVSPMVAWVLERREFTRDDLAAAFPERQSAQIAQLLRDLGAMRVTEPCEAVWPARHIAAILLWTDSRLMRRRSSG